jgi:uncharacterized protein (DUF362 family)
LFFGIDGNPMTGKLVRGEIFLASTDRIAIDLVGGAELKFFGSNSGVMR